MAVAVRDTSGVKRTVERLIASDNTERSGALIGADANILSSVSGLSIPAGSLVRVTFNIRKGAAAVAPLIGFRINATVVCSTASVGAVAFGGGVLAQSGEVEILFYVGQANYLQCGLMTAQLAETAYGNPLLYTTRGLCLNLAITGIPSATVTSLAVTADAVGAVTVSSNRLKVYA